MVSAQLTPAQVKKISKAIKDILLKDWDPIGIYMAGPDDEYDSYIWPIFKLLQDGADANKIADYLYELEKDIMGFSPDSKDTIIAVSEKLASLKKITC